MFWAIPDFFNFWLLFSVKKQPLAAAAIFLLGHPKTSLRRPKRRKNTFLFYPDFLVGLGTIGDGITSDGVGLSSFKGSSK